MINRKVLSTTLILLLTMCALPAAMKANDHSKHMPRPDDSKGANPSATRAVLASPDSLPADDDDQGASGYARAEMGTPPGLTDPIQKLEVDARDLSANQQYRIEVADRAAGGPNVVSLGVFLTDDEGELEVGFNSLATTNTPRWVVLNLGNIANVLAIDSIRIYRVDSAAPDGSVLSETLVLEGTFAPVKDRHRRGGQGK